MNRHKLLQQIIGVALVVLFLVGCGAPEATPTLTHVAIVVTATPQPTVTPVPPTVTLTPTLTPTPAGATIIGQIGRTDEVSRTTIVIPCLMVGDDACRVQHAWVARVSDEGSFKIAGIAPGTYTFFYGPDSAADSRAMWEGRLVHLESPVKIVNSFDLGLGELDGCRYVSIGELPDGSPTFVISDTVWLETISLQMDFPSGIDWPASGGIDLSGPEDSVPLQVEAKESETVNVTLTGLGCED